jgi:hypothetical protein
MKQTLIDLFTSKKFLAALTAIAVYVGGRFGFHVDPAALDRIWQALLVYVGAQGLADIGKSAAIAQSPANDNIAVAPSSSSSFTTLTKIGPAAVLALVVVGLTGLVLAPSCTHEQRAAAPHALVDCIAANAKAIGATAASMRAPTDEGGCVTAGVTNYGCVTAKAISAGLQIGGCAFVEVLDAPASTARLASATGPAPPERSGRAAFESYRASVAGGATFRTAAGDR